MANPKPRLLSSAMLWITLILAPSAAWAESWCAYPVEVHEWGVQVFGEASNPPGKLAHAYTPDTPVKSNKSDAVRHMDIDGGERELPILSFYAPAMWSKSIPLGVEVGFSEGEASHWYPVVDERVEAKVANGEEAAKAKKSLLDAREGRDPFQPKIALGADPTRQLIWESLSLSKEGDASATTHQAWVEALRKIEGALWVSGGGEKERFIYYEGRTEEEPMVQLHLYDTWIGESLELSNTSKWPVHDVFVIQRHGKHAWVHYVETLEAGAEENFSFSDAMDPQGDAFKEATRARLAKRLVDADQPNPPAEYRWGEECVMGRDPAIPVEKSSGHGLYEAEVEVLLDAWGPAFFEHEGIVVIYREAPASLDALMPLSIYTDMYHFVELQRAGLVLVVDPS